MIESDDAIPELREALAYDPRTGVFTWKVRRGTVIAGSIAGSTYGTGHRVICFKGRDYMAHRIAWMLVHGKWPCQFIDHKNGNPSDNRICNLREASPTLNSQNRRAGQRGKKYSPLIGAIWDRSFNTWKSRIVVDGKSHYLGQFSTDLEAHQAYIAAKRKLHPGCTI